MENFIKSTNKMKILKKIWLLLAWLSVIFCIGFSQWLRAPSPKYAATTTSDATATVDGTTVKSGSINDWSQTISNQLHGIINTPNTDTEDDYTTSLWYVITLIQKAINRLLWILAFIALVYMLYNWFLVLTSWSESKNADKGKKWISTAAIALAWIWLSWLIVSAIIWIIGVISN